MNLNRAGKNEKKAEQEYKKIGFESAQEVIDAIAKASEAAEKAVAHMDCKEVDGESLAGLVLQQTKPKSIRNFLQMMSLLGMEEDQKKKEKRSQKKPIQGIHTVEL